MKEWIGQTILPFADAMYTIINSIPMGIVRAFVFGIFVALALWVLSMSPQLPEQDHERSSMIKDLRIFAVAVLVLQSLLYIIF